MIFCLCFWKTAGTAKRSPCLNRYFSFKQFFYTRLKIFLQTFELFDKNFGQVIKNLCPGYEISLPRLWTTETWSFLPSAPATTSRRCTPRWVFFSTPHHVQLSTFFKLLSTASMIFTSTTLRRTVVSRRTSLERFSRETFTWEQVEWTSSFAMHTVDEDNTSRCDKIKHWHHWTWLDKLDVTFRREKEDSWHTKWDRTQPDQKMVGLNSKLSRKDIPQQD